MLDQTEIDALLSSATELATETGAGALGGGIPSARASSSVCGNQPAVNYCSKELGRILHMRVTLSVVLAERDMALKDILELTPGSIIEFDRSSDEELYLTVGEHKVGAGQAVKVGEYFGLRVAWVGPPEERVRAMGD